MENEIKVGDYCRTRKGIIGILKQQFIFGHGVNYPEPQEWVIDINGKQYVTTECDVDFDNIVKHSPNLIDLIQCGDYVNGEIIDLIQCGDYVNGEIIDQIQNDRNPKLIWHLSSYGDDDMVFKNEDIETVATKEMMESITYKVTKM